MSSEKTTTIVIFGASGDLTRRKLIPALYTLQQKGRLPADFNVVGVARRPWDSAEFRSRVESGVQEFAREPYDAEVWAEFSQKLHYVPGDATKPEDFANLKTKIDAIESKDADRIYYLSVTPRFFSPIVDHLGMHGMTKEDEGFRRVIVEKPFGTDLASAIQLNKDLHEVLEEDQIYRIDHYLAKETVQNLLVFRFANTLFEPVWNRNYIDSVQITAAESVDVGHRAGYYDTSGVLRDMFQNHLLQLLTLVAMEPPPSFKANAIRNEKVKVLASVRPIADADLAINTVRAQYADYLKAEGVAEGSQTPTFAALKLNIDNWRWRGVPFYLRSGKALAKKATEINIQFKKPPHMMFPLPEGYEIEENVLAICIQPDEGVHLNVQAKVPDTDADMETVVLDFHYNSSFGEGAIPEAYERLLLEALEGDASLFTRGDSIELAWGIIDPIINGWTGEHAPTMATYEPGSWGPKESDELVSAENHHWVLGCGGHD